MNIALCLFTGTLLLKDKLGINNTMTIACSMLVCGNALCWIASIFRQFYVALLGRLLAGIGIECLNVAIYAFISIWFGSSNHGFALSLSVVSVRSGSVVSSFLVPIL